MNIAKILKYCPKGTKLYSPAYGEVKFIEIVNPIKIRIEIPKSFINNIKHVSNNGNIAVGGECMLFPSKEQRDWNKFRLPIKRGDIMMNYDGSCPFIATGELYENISPKYICGINSLGEFEKYPGKGGWTSDFYIPASEEAKKELFDKIEEAGYKWNADNLELEQIEPKFKEGDVLINILDTLFLSTGVIIGDRIRGYYLFVNGTFASCDVLISSLKLASKEDRNKLFSAIAKGGYIYDKKQHKLIKQEFKQFENVLVRDDLNNKWLWSIFLCYDDEVDKDFPYVCLNGRWCYCIPYKCNEYLLGTTINTNDI